MKIKNKIIIISIWLFMLFAILFKVEAANATISASKTNATVGDSITISVSMNAAAWNTKLTGAVTQNYAGNSDDGENMNKVETYTFTPTAAGTYTIKLGGDVSDGSTNQTTPVGGEVTITVADKQPVQQPVQEPVQQPVQEPTQQPTQQPAQEPVQQPVQQPEQEPVQQQPAEPNFSNANTTMYTTGNVNLRASWSTASAATSVPQGTELVVTGTSTDKVNGFVWYKVIYNGQTKYIASNLLTSTKPADPEEDDKEDKDEEDKDDEKSTEKSTNKALKDLVIENYKLTPEFSPENTKYLLEVTKDVEKLEITPIPQDEKAKCEVTGNENLKIGNNIVRITVTAEDGTTRLYSITVTKTKEDGEDQTAGLRLSKLQIPNIELNPSFDPSVTNYMVTVTDLSKIKKEDIVAVAEDEKVEVTVAETDQSETNGKIFTIILENEDGTQTGIYQIEVKKSIMAPVLSNNKDNKIYYILGGIIVALVLLIIVVVVLLRRSSNNDDMYDVQEADELDDDYDYSLKNAIDEANTDFDETKKYDEIIENSNIKSQILNPKEYNVFKDVDESDDDEYDDEYDEDLNDKKRGKHF